MKCPASARLCKAKLEYDLNQQDLGTIGFIEIGTRDLDVILNDDGPCENGSGDEDLSGENTSDEDFGDDGFGGERAA
jgi:hypothetical protein